MAAAINKMAGTFLLLIIVVIAEAHMDPDGSSLSETSSGETQMENKPSHRRKNDIRREWQYEGLPIELPNRRQMLTTDESDLSKPGTLLGNATWTSLQTVSTNKQKPIKEQGMFRMEPFLFIKPRGRTNKNHSSTNGKLGIANEAPQLQTVTGPHHRNWPKPQPATSRAPGLMTIVVTVSPVPLLDKVTGGPRLKYLTVPSYKIAYKTKERTTKDHAHDLSNSIDSNSYKPRALVGNKRLQYVVKSYKRTPKTEQKTSIKSSAYNMPKPSLGSPSDAPRLQYLTVPSYKTWSDMTKTTFRSHSISVDSGSDSKSETKLGSAAGAPRLRYYETSYAVLPDVMKINFNERGRIDLFSSDNYTPFTSPNVIGASENKRGVMIPFFRFK